jgi:hypothetical protein
MYMGDVSGCHEVPDPICPRFITFPALADPILIPIPASDMTSSGFILEASSLICIPGIWLEGLGDGVAAGVGVPCVCVDFPGDGEAVGDGDAAGIFIPGI